MTLPPPISADSPTHPAPTYGDLHVDSKAPSDRRRRERRRGIDRRGTSSPTLSHATILVLLTIGLWLALATSARGVEPAPTSEPDASREPDAVYVAAGDRAPFPGILMPPGRAATLGSKLETCQLHRDMDTELRDAKATIQFDACRAKLGLADAASKDREALLRKALENADGLAKENAAAAQRASWDHSLVLSVGVVGGIVVGVAATVGAVYLVGQLRPAIPPA